MTLVYSASGQVQSPTAPVPTPRAQTAAPVAPGTLNNPPVVSTPAAVGRTFERPVIGLNSAPSPNTVTDRAAAAQRIGIPADATAGQIAPRGLTPGWITNANARRIAPSAPAGLRIGTQAGTASTATTIVPGTTTPVTIAPPVTTTARGAAAVSPSAVTVAPGTRSPLAPQTVFNPIPTVSRSRVVVDLPPGSRVVTPASDETEPVAGSTAERTQTPAASVGSAGQFQTERSRVLPPPGSSATPLNPSIRSPNIIQTRPTP